jgi:lactate dehydrogenase-like 2-hydroxyacid dehydrogenase
MAGDKADVLLVGPAKKLIVDGLDGPFKLHVLAQAGDPDELIGQVASGLRAIASTAPSAKVTRSVIERLPRLEIISSFGVGYDNIDIKAAIERKIVVCNTPQVLTEEVADTALGLLLCTVREFPQAERYLRAGKWTSGDYPLTKASLRNRTVGMVGLGAIGKAIARRLEAFGVPVVYHSRNEQRGVSYRYYPKLVEMARDVDTLIVITPGGPATRNLINAEVLSALGPNGILINMARGSVVDEPALIRPCRTARSIPPVLTCSWTSRTCLRNCSRWTTSSCSRISARPLCIRGRKWSSWLSTICWPGRRASHR